MKLSGILLFLFMICVAAAATGDVPTTLSFGEPSPTTRPPVSANPVRRVQFRMDDRGRCELTVNAPEQSVVSPPSTDPSKNDLGINTFKGASAARHGNRFDIAYDFRNGSGATDFVNGTIHYFSDTLIIDTNAEDVQRRKFANLRFPREIRVPFEIDYSPTQYIESTGLHLNWRTPAGWTHLVIDAFNDHVKAVWFIDKPPAKPIVSVPLKKDGPTKCAFLFPGTFPLEWSIITMSINGGPGGPLGISQIAFHGRLRGLFGVGLDGADKVIVQQVMEGPAMRAGIQAGDILVAIDEHHLNNGQVALEYLSKHEPGESCIWTVQRNGQTAKVKISCE